MTSDFTSAIFNCIREHGPISAEDIVTRTGYIRYLIDLTIGVLIEHGLVYPIDRPAGEPVYAILEPV